MIFQVFPNQPLTLNRTSRFFSFIGKVFRRCLKVISKTAFAKRISFLDQKEKKIKDRSIADYLKTLGVGIIFYPLPSSAVIEGIPYIVNNWDLAHFGTYAFPEIALTTAALTGATSGTSG